MNASIRGIMFVKADRIDERIDLCAEKFLNRYGENLNKDNFKEFLKSIHIIVDTELNEKGVDRKWKASSQKFENLKIASKQVSTKEPMNLLKTLMMKLHLMK